VAGVVSITQRNYISKIYDELNRRGVSSEEIPIVIGKTGFMNVMQNYAEEQMHYSIKNAVDEILLTAATH
jgi:hypothetical protein